MIRPNHQHLEDLLERVRTIEESGRPGGGRQARVSTGLPAVDAVLGGGLLDGAVHEWFSPDEGEAGEQRWHPPLGVLMHLARRALARGPGWAVWVGRGCWPHGHGLVGEGDEALARSLWVSDEVRNSPKSEVRSPKSGGRRGKRRWAGEIDARLWAIDLAARSPGVRVVIADGSGVDMAASRRLQLAAEAGQTLVLLGRPWADRQLISAATTRWHVSPVVTQGNEPRWQMELLRCKGSQRQAGQDAPSAWLIEGVQSHGQGLVVVPAEPGDRSPEAEAADERRQRA